MRDIDRYEQVYLQDNHDFERYQVRYRRKKMLELYEKLPSSHVLEIGCGMEPLFHFVPQDSFSRWIVVEPAESFFKAACQAAAEDDRIVCLNRFFGEEKTVLEECRKQSDGNFDLIVCTSLLHELENPESFLRGIRALCSTETYVLLNVPNAHSLHRLLGMRSGYIADTHEITGRNKEWQQHRVFDLASLTAFLEHEGFSVDDAGSFFIKPFTHRQMEACLAHHIIDESVLDGFYRLSKDMPELGSELYAICRARA